MNITKTASLRHGDFQRSELAEVGKTGLWKDRSGAFQIDGEGQKLIAGFTGEFETVVGFPVKVFMEMREILTDSPCSDQ